MPVLWLKPLVVAVLSLGGIHAVVRQRRAQLDLWVMRVVRDIGRFKAKKRRHQNTKGLVAFLSHVDDNPDQDLLEMQASLSQDMNLATYTTSELYEFGDGEDGRPILLSVFGHVYDVSAGARFYGPESPYSGFAGRDVTYSLCTGCRTPECLSTAPDDLTETQISEGKRWLSFFHLHDKYHLVGKLETDYLEAILGNLTVDELTKDDQLKSTSGGLKPPIFQQ